MDVGSQTDVVGQIPSRMIGIFIKDDLVTTPVPVIAVADVIGRDGEIESAEPETVGPSAVKVPHMVRSEAAREVTVLPWMVKVIVGIVEAGIVPHPGAVLVNVGAFGCPG